MAEKKEEGGVYVGDDLKVWYIYRVDHVHPMSLVELRPLYQLIFDQCFLFALPVEPLVGGVRRPQTRQQEESTKHYEGQCMCGAVHIDVTQTKAAVELYCHCSDCTAHHSSLMVQLIAFSASPNNPEASYLITKGGDKLTKLNYSPKVSRYFCNICGSPVVNELAELEMFETFPTVIKSYPYKPKAHLYFRNKRLPFPIADGLPKYADLPEKYGGSDCLLTDDYVCPSKD